MPIYNIEAYTDLLKTINKSGIPFIGYRDPKKYGVILRHDIDYCMESAYQIAEIDYAANIKSTFFVLVSSPLYNMYNPLNAGLLKKIAELGHAIGLHYHPEQDQLNVERFLLEFQILHTLMPNAFKLVAWHNPKENLIVLNQTAEALGFICAYDNRYFESSRYLSDSNCRHTSQGIVEQITNNPNVVYQLLLHPIIWSRGGLCMEDILNKVFCDQMESIFEAFRQNNCWAENNWQEIFFRNCLEKTNRLDL